MVLLGARGALRTARIRPHGRLEIDRAHPLAQRLVFLAIPGWEQRTDLVSGGVGTQMLATASTWLGQSAIGEAFDATNLVSGGLSYPWSDRLLNITTQLTVVVALKPVAFDSGGHLLSVPYSSTWAAPFGSIRFLNASTTVLGLQYADTTTTRQSVVSAAGAIQTTDPLTFYAGVRDGTAARFYRGGVLHSSTTFGASVNTVFSTNKQRITLLNRHALSSGEAATGQMPFAAIWSRPLTAGELGLLAADPFSMLIESPHRFYLVVPDGTPGTPTYTLSGTGTAPAPAGSGTGLTFTNPTYTLSGSGSVPVPSGSGTGLAVTQPVYTLSGGGSVPAPTGSGTGLTYRSNSVLSGGGSVPAPSGSGAGFVVTQPTYTLSGSGSVPAPTGGGAGLATATPFYTLSGGGTVPAPSGSGAGLTFTKPTYTLSGAGAVPAPTGSGAGLTYRSSGVLSGAGTVPAPVGSGAGLAVVNPVYTLSGAGTIPAPTGGGAGFSTVSEFLSGGAALPFAIVTPALVVAVTPAPPVVPPSPPWAP